MRVYRIEFPHPDGGYVGPYCAPFRIGTAIEIYTLYMGIRHSGKHETHPAIEGPRGTSCAVHSMRELFAWFGGYIPVLLRFGARIGVYEVPESGIYGARKSQVLYWRKHAVDVTPRR